MSLFSDQHDMQPEPVKSNKYVGTDLCANAFYAWCHASLDPDIFVAQWLMLRLRGVGSRSPILRMTHPPRFCAYQKCTGFFLEKTDMLKQFGAGPYSHWNRRRPRWQTRTVGVATVITFCSPTAGALMRESWDASDRPFKGDAFI